MAFDCKGRAVEVGTKVRVLEVARFLKRELPPDEWQELKTMVGEVFAVYEIDEYGAAWVEKRWNKSGRERHSHSIGLHSNEMEVV